MTLLYADDVAEVHHATWRELLDTVRERGGCDAVIVDAPYSARTHKGHDSGAASANRVKANGVKDTGRERRAINYAPWSHDDVDAFVDAWSPLCREWFVSLTDDVLFGTWRAAMELNDRQTFQDIPAIIRGATARLTGDGPASWAIHCAVGRTRSQEMVAWGTLPGGYFGAAESAGKGRSTPVVGGKPLWLMRAIVRDYVRPGSVVVDPCCGRGTTGIAARDRGCRVILGDALLEHAEMAADEMRRAAARPPFFVPGAASLRTRKRKTLSLFSEAL